MTEQDALNRDTLDARLIKAVLRADLGTVHRLLADGADARTRDAASGLTALMIASGEGQVEVVQALLAAGADLFATDSKAGAAALHKACQGGSLEVVSILVGHLASL